MKARHLYPMIFVRVVFWIVIISCHAFSTVFAGTSPSVITPTPPLLFEKNQGQFNENVDYVARGKGYSIVLSEQPVIELYRYRKVPVSRQDHFDNSRKTRTEIDEVTKIRLNILGAKQSITAIPLEQQAARTNYLFGEPSNWKTDIRNFKRVRYAGVLEKIDVEYYGRNGRLEYDFVVHPGGDPGTIRLNFDGAVSVHTNRNGDLVINMGEHEIVQLAPVSYQLGDNGQRLAIASSYTIENGQVGFELGEFDPQKSLVIDPVLEYSRYHGGSLSESAHAIDLDAADNIYVVGLSSSPGLGTIGAYQETNPGERFESSSFSYCTDCLENLVSAGTATMADAGTVLVDNIATFMTDGVAAGALVRNLDDGSSASVSTVDSETQITHLALSGGSENDWDLAEAYEIYVAGTVERVRIVRNDSSIVISKFSPDGGTVIWTTYFNAASPLYFLIPGVNSAAVSATGEVAFSIAARQPGEGGLPLVNETQTHSASEKSAYIAKLNSAGNGLVFGTYLNIGDGFNWARGLDVSASGEVAITGLVGSSSAPTTGFPEVNPIAGQSCTLNLGVGNYYKGYVAKFASNGDLVFSSCIGGETGGISFQALSGVAFGANGDLYTVGRSGRTDFPTVNPIQATIEAAGFRVMTISQIDPDTSTLLFSTYFGPGTTHLPPNSANGLIPTDIVTDSGGNIIVTGTLNSLGYPNVNAHQPNLAIPRDSMDYKPGQIPSAFHDIFITRMHPTNGVIFSTFLGGSNGEYGFQNLAVDGNDNIYVITETFSDNYPLVNPIQWSFPGIASVALSKFTPNGALAFSTYFGGTDEGSFEIGSTLFAKQFPGGVAVNSAGNIILAGTAGFNDFPELDSGTSLAGSSDITLSIIDQSGDTDSDGDGVPDAVDAFSADINEWRNSDGDLTGDNADTDDDGDGEPDVSDAFPKDATEIADTDNDGAGDNRDLFDADANEYYDLDTDGTGDFSDPDVDGDGTDSPDDQLDYDNTELLDYDFDGIGNIADLDDDNDGFTDGNDPDPMDSQVPVLNFSNYNAQSTFFKNGLPEGFDPVAGADLPWTSATDESFSDTTSLGSRIIGHGETASVRYTANFTEGSLVFRYKVDSEVNDLLTVKLDAATILTDSGDSGWVLFSTPISAGQHTVEFTYSKDGSVTAGADAAWIDDIQQAFDCSLSLDVSQVECDALTTIYLDMGGPGWTRQSGWLGDPNVCGWENVSCDGGSNIIDLYLGNNNLSGPISTAFTDLTSLTRLALGDNDGLTGMLPSRVWQHDRAARDPDFRQ